MSRIEIMALRHSAFYSPLLMTMAGGFCAEEGLEPHYALATPENGVDDSIRSSRCHLAQSAVSTSFSGLERGEESNIVHFAQINARDGFFLAGREADECFDWRKLEGKTVLVDHFFQPMAMFRYALMQNGVNIDAIEIIDAGDVDAIDSAFRSGMGDYVHQQGPAPQQLESDGLAHVLAAVGDAVGPVAFSSLCASREWLESDMAESFMRAYRKSLKYVAEAPAAEIAAKEAEAGYFPDVDRDVLVSTISAYQNLGCWRPDPRITENDYNSLLEVFLCSNLISKKHPFSRVISNLE